MRGENGTESLVVFFFCLAYSNRKTKCQNYRKNKLKLKNVKMNFQDVIDIDIIM